MNLDPRRSRDLARAAQPLAVVARLIDRHGYDIALNLAAWYPGPASPALDTSPTPIADDGTTPGPTPRAALGHDIIATAARDLARHLDHAARSAETARRLLLSLLAIDADTAAQLADRAPADRSGTCANCGTYIANTPTDRIKAGRCAPCYQWRRRHHGDERPRAQWETDDANGNSGNK